jgi:hypothetical protein
MSEFANRSIATPSGRIALEGNRPIHLPTVKATEDPATIGKVDIVMARRPLAAPRLDAAAHRSASLPRDARGPL